VGTFLLNIILARHLTSSEYGIFTLVLFVAYIVQLANFWLFAYPLGIRLAGAGREEGSRLSTTSLAAVAALNVPLSAPVGVTLFAFGRSDLIIACITWLILWQLQQAARRALIANLRVRAAVLGDAITYLGSGVAIGLLAKGGITMSLAEAFYATAGMATLGAIVQALQLRITLRGLYPPHRWLLDNVSLGTWSLAAGAVLPIRNQLVVWLLAALSGPASVASLQAATNIFMVLNPIVLSLASLVPQVTARAFENGDKRSAWRVARPYIMIAIPPTLFYTAFAVLFSPFLLLLFYGEGSSYLKLGDLLPYLAISEIGVPTELIICYFLGISETKLALKINLLGAAAVVISVLPLFATIGALEGACAAFAVSELMRFAFAVMYLRRLLAGLPPGQSQLVRVGV
jgi:O-antigen/teichoic acid export membrane protein